MKATRLQALRDMQERGTIRRGHVIEMLDEIKALREQIKSLGDQADVCVSVALGGAICNGCRCGKIKGTQERMTDANAAAYHGGEDDGL